MKTKNVRIFIGFVFISHDPAKLRSMTKGVFLPVKHYR